MCERMWSVYSTALLSSSSSRFKGLGLNENDLDNAGLLGLTRSPAWPMSADRLVASSIMVSICSSDGTPPLNEDCSH